MTFKAGSSPRTFFSNASALIRTIASRAWLTSVSRSSEAEGSAFMVWVSPAVGGFNRFENTGSASGAGGTSGKETRAWLSDGSAQVFEPIESATRRKEGGSSSEHGGSISKLPEASGRRTRTHRTLIAQAEASQCAGLEMQVLRFRCKRAT